MAVPEIMSVSVKVLPNIFSDFTWLPSPIDIEMRDDAPTPTNKPNAIRIIIIGNANAKPDNAKGPTPCPINMRSTIL